MKSTEFCYFLQGLFELSDVKTLNEQQVQMIKNHLKLVFLYDIDPLYTDDKNLQHIFQNIHDGKEPFNGLSVKPNIISNPNNIINNCIIFIILYFIFNGNVINY